MRAIDADALIGELHTQFFYDGRDRTRVYARIQEQPTIEERKTGRWIDGQCSVCGCDVPAYIIDWKWQKDMDARYCPNCGADMREDT